MRLKRFVSLTLVLSLSLSACQLSDLQTLVGTEQVITKEPTWSVDGDTFTTTASYDIPKGTESNTFSLVINDGVIKSIEIGITADNKASLKYQKDFADNISSLIVGKKISELKSIDRVSGASLTTNAFNEAISRLQSELNS